MYGSRTEALCVGPLKKGLELNFSFSSNFCVQYYIIVSCETELSLCVSLHWAYATGHSSEG